MWETVEVRFRLLGLVVVVAACEDGSGVVGEMAESIPDIEHCDSVASWNDEDVAMEDALSSLLAARRDRGADCGSAGFFGPAPALRPSGALRCAARRHVLDMAVRNFLGHEDPDGLRVTDRVRAVDYAFADVAETIAAADIEPARVLDEVWLSRAGSCATLMAAEYTDVGVGYLGGVSETYGGLWTVVVAVPAPP